MTLLPGHKSRLSRAPSLRPSLNEPFGSKSNSDKIRLVHIINDVSIGGAEMMLYKLLSQVNRERFDPIVVALRNRGQLHRRIEALDVPVYNVSMQVLRANYPDQPAFRLIEMSRVSIVAGAVDDRRSIGRRAGDREPPASRVADASRG